MVLVFAARIAEAADYARAHALDGAMCFGDLIVALGGFRLGEHDEVYVLPSTSPAIVGVIRRQWQQLSRPPVLHLLPY